MKKNADPLRLDHDRPLESSRAHRLRLEDAAQGLADVEAGRFTDANPALQNLKAHRAEGTFGTKLASGSHEQWPSASTETNKT